ncbi:MAG: ABC transporter substrate-binding protein [Ktedonobacteraceae bacterium]|nr:ABC transporter substrate-binding protein [Ktedonobacteraceae bacterium]
MEERLPPACAFAISVLDEYKENPQAVPEEALEAAQQHMSTCSRCLGASPSLSSPSEEQTTPRLPAAPSNRKKKRGRQAAASQDTESSASREQSSNSVDRNKQALQLTPSASVATLPTPGGETTGKDLALATALTEQGTISCEQCRLLLPEYAEALEQEKNAATLYPEVQLHLLTCESGCPLILELLQQEIRTGGGTPREPIRNPFSVIGWELSGFFHGGQLTLSPRMLASGTLILLLIVASLSAYLGISWNEWRHRPASVQTIPTPDGIGLSDGLKIFDACNAAAYKAKRDAAQAMKSAAPAQAEKLLGSAINAAQSDTSGCNSAEAAIYRENLHVRQSGRPYVVVVVSFDSGPGNASPQGGTDRHFLYAAATQELIGAFIAQQQYNATQMKTEDAPLLYLILANTTGIEPGALQIANMIATLARSTDLQQLGLLASGPHSLVGVVGLGPSKLTEVTLPVLCRAGIPLFAPTSTGPFVTDLLTQTSLYRHCAPGFAFIRTSPDDASQSEGAASFAYNKLKARNAAIFYDPGNPSSQASAQAFANSFTHNRDAHIVARETAITSSLRDVNGQVQASQEDLQASLDDALRSKVRPDLIFASLLTNDVITITQAIAHLPEDQQPMLILGGTVIHPASLQGLVRWARQQQLTLPHIFISAATAVHPPTGNDWQKQFYATFCTSFAGPGGYCSGAAALDQGALLFGDSIRLITQSLNQIDAGQLPGPEQTIKHISNANLAGVSGPITLKLHDDVLITNEQSTAVILGLQQDGSIQIVE